MESAPKQIGSFEIGDVFSRAFDAIGANAGLSLTLALPLAGIPSALMSWWVQVNGYGGDMPRFYAGMWSSTFLTPLILVWLVSLATDAVLQGGIIRATVRSLSGKTSGFGDALEIGFGRLLTIMGINLVVAIGVGFATLLLIVPGIILAICWLVCVPATVEEGTGIGGSLDRSMALTRGERWKLFVILLVVWVAMWVLTYVSGTLGALLGSGDPVAPAVIQGIATAIGRIVWVALAATIYVQLRNAKEGAAPSELETVFS